VFKSLGQEQWTMYTEEILQEGIERLGITDPNLIAYIRITNWENLEYLKEKEERKKALEEHQNRHKVPHGLKKKEYEQMLKETQAKIYELKAYINENPETLIGEDEQDKWIAKKEKIKNILKFFGKKTDEINIPKAKEYPVEQLLDFSRSRFTDCIFHSTGKQNTPSLHWDKRRNKVHCFSCGKDADAIDIYQTLYNVTLIEAVKKLT
jgi:hypothetical protein